MSPVICNLSCRRIKRIMKLQLHNLFKFSGLFTVNRNKLHNFIMCALICNYQEKKDLGLGTGGLNCSLKLSFTKEKVNFGSHV